LTRTSLSDELGLLDSVVGPVSGVNVIHGLSIRREIHGNHRELEARPSLNEEDVKIIAKLEKSLDPFKRPRSRQPRTASIGG